MFIPAEKQTIFRVAINTFLSNQHRYLFVQPANQFLRRAYTLVNNAFVFKHKFIRANFNNFIFAYWLFAHTRR